MRDVVLWSGGCDSTLALVNASNEAALERKTRSSPLALTIIQPQVTANAENARAREAIKKWLAKNHYPADYAEVKISQSMGWHGAHPSEGGQPQALLWLTVSANYIGNGDTLMAGYVRGDDFWHGRHHHQEAFSVLMRIADCDAKIAFPLEWKTKTDVVRELKGHKGLLPLCWSCQIPSKGRPCGDCVSCIKHADAVRHIEESKKKWGKLAQATKG